VSADGGRFLDGQYVKNVWYLKLLRS
jgi:hypothetical protein